jgi:hypothetical protein
MDFASRALENGHVVMKIDGPDGFTVVVAGPAKELPRFEKALSAIMGGNAGPSKTKKTKKTKKPRASKTVLFDDHDAVWTVCAHGFGAMREDIEQFVDSALIDSAIEAGELVEEDTWIRVPDAADKEKAVFDAMREKAESHKDGVVFRQTCGAIVRKIYPEYYSSPFFRALMDAAVDEHFVEETVTCGSNDFHTYRPV